MNAQIERGTASVTHREDTTADDCLSRLRFEILKAMFTRIYSNGTRGAPSHPFCDEPAEFAKHAAAEDKYLGCSLKEIPWRFDKSGDKSNTKKAWNNDPNVLTTKMSMDPPRPPFIF